MANDEFSATEVKSRDLKIVKCKVIRNITKLSLKLNIL